MNTACIPAAAFWSTEQVVLQFLGRLAQPWVPGCPAAGPPAAAAVNDSATRRWRAAEQARLEQ